MSLILEKAAFGVIFFEQTFTYDDVVDARAKDFCPAFMIAEFIVENLLSCSEYDDSTESAEYLLRRSINEFLDVLQTSSMHVFLKAITKVNAHIEMLSYVCGSYGKFEFEYEYRNGKVVVSLNFIE